jgi:hypothetical protein
MIIFKDGGDKIREENSNQRFFDIKGNISDNDARLSLVDFLKNNIDFTTELLFGMKLFPFQSYLISQWWNNSFSINIWTRGGGKSYSVAIFCLLYGIFHNTQRIILTSASFRSSRAIMAQMEKFIQADGATLLRQCYPYDIKRSTDLWEMNLPGGGCIRALPLNEKIRGQRADVLICDEGLLISKVLMEGTIKPFLLSKNNVQEQLKIKEYEDALVKKGVIKEEDRMILESEKKMIILSSASFEFEYLYEIYKSWLEKSGEKNSKYFVNRLSYAALPKELIEQDIIKEAESGGIQSTYFQREYMAKFPSASDGYFNLIHMNECTIPAGDYPCIQIQGDEKAEYILSIDPSFSSSKTSDYFAMGLFLIDKETKSITLVNSYGVPGGRLSQHIGYLYYLLTNFNIVLITADLLGGFESGNFNFLESANQSSLFKNAGLSLKSFEGEFNSNDYIEDLKLMRKTYSKLSKTICYRQKFTSQWIKDANEYMQHFIQSKKLFFASKITNNDKEFERYSKYKLPFEIENEAGNQMTITEFCDEQDNLIDETKNQITLICPRTSPQGTMTFDLPPEVKAIKGEKRARRDNYTTTLMACWASKFYFDYLDDSLGKTTSFRPRFIA